MHLGAFLFNLGNHVAGWRMPGVPVEGLMAFSFYRDLAAIAERGKFDLLFHSDGLGINDSYDAVLRHSITIRPEPLTLLSALAVTTHRIGLAATVSTTYNEPYHVARKLAMLDFLSEGRAAVNLVTSSTDLEARNFGQPVHAGHAERYARAGEFVEVLRRLWDSWEDGAVELDQARGVVADPARIHKVDWQGQYFSVRGPLNMPRPPQGHPVIIQAGTSADGQAFAAGVADLIFTVEHSIDKARRWRAAVAERARAAGRTVMPRILPGLLPILGRTEAEAQAQDRALRDLVPAPLAVSTLSDLLQHDLARYPLDGPLPALPPSNGEVGRRQMILEKARAPGATIRSLAAELVQNRGHLRVVGTPAMVADFMSEWFTTGACDGFNILAPFHPEGLAAFVDGVVPELQRRNLFRQKYEGQTLRDHFGLAKPDGRPPA
ncbi:putative monooxygenase YxeK [Acidisoma sp. 7E03]